MEEDALSAADRLLKDVYCVVWMCSATTINDACPKSTNTTKAGRTLGSGNVNNVQRTQIGFYAEGSQTERGFLLD